MGAWELRRRKFWKGISRAGWGGVSGLRRPRGSRESSPSASVEEKPGYKPGQPLDKGQSKPQTPSTLEAEVNGLSPREICEPSSVWLSVTCPQWPLPTTLPQGRQNFHVLTEAYGLLP